MLIVKPEEMQEIEKNSKENYLFTPSILIENVGCLCAEFIFRKMLATIEYENIIVVVGSGRNGSYAMSTARHLLRYNIQCKILLLSSLAKRDDDNNMQIKMLASYGIQAQEITESSKLESYFLRLPKQIVVIDGVYGLGARFPLPIEQQEMFEVINNFSTFTISLDIPSGISAETGKSDGTTIIADQTIAIGLPKTGYYLSQGPKSVGKIKTIDFGIPAKLINKPGKYQLLNPKWMKDFDLKRNKFADKKTFGHTLVIGGSHGMTGALCLASHAALKIGSGLVTAVTWEPQYHELTQRLMPEVMSGYIPLDESKWESLLEGMTEKYSSIVIGPGLAKSLRARKLVLMLLENYRGPIILDADAINVLNVHDDAKIFGLRDFPVIMTPHLGEFAKFLRVDFSKVEEDSLVFLEDVMEKINCFFVLKGPCSFIARPDGKIFFNYFPNDGLATGGSGDVLAGI